MESVSVLKREWPRTPINIPSRKEHPCVELFQLLYKLIDEFEGAAYDADVNALPSLAYTKESLKRVVQLLRRWRRDNRDWKRNFGLHSDANHQQQQQQSGGDMKCTYVTTLLEAIDAVFRFVCTLLSWFRFDFSSLPPPLPPSPKQPDYPSPSDQIAQSRHLLATCQTIAAKLENLSPDGALVLQRFISAVDSALKRHDTLECGQNIRSPGGAMYAVDGPRTRRTFRGSRPSDAIGDPPAPDTTEQMVDAEICRLESDLRKFARKIDCDSGSNNLGDINSSELLRYMENIGLDRYNIDPRQFSLSGPLDLRINSGGEEGEDQI